MVGESTLSSPPSFTSAEGSSSKDASSSQKSSLFSSPSGSTNKGEILNGKSAPDDDDAESLSGSTVSATIGKSVDSTPGVDKKRKLFNNPYDGKPPPKKPALDLEGRNLHCTACSKQLNWQSFSSFGKHPKLGVLLCKACLYNIADPEAEWTFDPDNGFQEQCTWCGTGGSLCLCDNCTHTFCTKCIKRNFDRRLATVIIDADKWRCFICDLSPLFNMREICDALYETHDFLRYQTFKRKHPHLFRKANDKKFPDKIQRNEHSTDTATTKPTLKRERKDFGGTTTSEQPAAKKLKTSPETSKNAAELKGMATLNFIKTSKPKDLKVSAVSNNDGEASTSAGGEPVDLNLVLSQLDRAAKLYGHQIRLIQKALKSEMDDIFGDLDATTTEPQTDSTTANGTSVSKQPTTATANQQMNIVRTIQEAAHALRSTLVLNADSEMWALNALERGVTVNLDADRAKALVAKAEKMNKKEQSDAPSSSKPKKKHVYANGPMNVKKSSEATVPSSPTSSGPSSPKLGLKSETVGIASPVSKPVKLPNGHISDDDELQVVKVYSSPAKK